MEEAESCRLKSLRVVDVAERNEAKRNNGLVCQPELTVGHPISWDIVLVINGKRFNETTKENQRHETPVHGPIRS
jgi:hypothetical protein